MYIENSSNERWKEQYNRVKRLYQRVKKIQQNTPEYYSEEDCLDDIYCFFMNCYHLKDWINFSVPTLVINVESLFDKDNGKECMKICADFTNGIKHVEVDRNIRISSKITVKGQSITISVPTLSFDNSKNKDLIVTCQYNWSINVNGENYNLFALADECFNEWENFIKKNLE